MRRRITLSWNDRGAGDINTDLQWLCYSLGLFPIRDYNSSMYRLFIELVKDRRTERVSTSDELAARVGLTRGTVVHHLNKMMETGIVLRSEAGYALRDATVERMVGSIRREVDRLFTDIEDVAKRIDEQLS